MSNITNYLRNELYPTLFNSIDRAFPELNFQHSAKGWISPLKLDGSNPKKPRRDKTVVTKTAPGIILEQGGEVLSLVDYVMRRDSVDLLTAIKTLTEIAGLQTPRELLSDPEAYQRHKDKTTLLEACNSYFIFCLENSTGAEEVRDYLSLRGYSVEEAKTMELGYIPSQDKLFKYLLNKKYSQELISETLQFIKGIGSTHRLTIPYRSGGSLKGFKFRALGDTTPKYLNSTGMNKSGGFFNLMSIKGDKDVVIVEGELDSLHATVKGIDNVVALGGSSINSDQVKDAIKRGAKKFTICLDQEPGKEEETANRVNSVIEVIQREEVNSVYVVTLPALGGIKTDPDRLIKERGVDAFKTAIAQATPYWEYKLIRIFSKYIKIQEERSLLPKEIDNFLQEIVETSTSLPEPIDRDRFKKAFLSQEAIKPLGITEESLSITVDKITSTRDKENQAKEFKKLLSEATALQGKGEVNKALELLDGRVREVKLVGAKDLLPPPLSFTTLLEEIATLPPAYKTGYSSLDSFIGFTPGAITLIAGRPSHGKTTFMFNLLLQMSGLYRDESFYFFTYEEPVKNISVKLLNRLTATDLSGYFREIKDLPKPTNYEFLKAYIRARRTDIREVEEGKRQLRELIDSQKIKVIDRNYSVEELSSLIAYLQKKERIGAIIIDYIQRMRTERKTQDKRTEIAHISDQVLQIAKDSGLPIILGAQLNRATMTSGSKKPALENLKEAGNLEEDANTVLSVYNESREKAETPEGETYNGLREVELEIKALKNREGEVNQTALLTFDKWTGVIKNQDRTSFKDPF